MDEDLSEQTDPPDDAESLLAWRIEKARAMHDEFRRTPATDDTIRVALGFFSGYPLLYWGRIIHGNKSATETLLAHLNDNHKDAMRLLMRLAKERGLDPFPLWESARVCRELFAYEPMREEPGITPPHWPDILGKRRYSLPQAQQDAIRDGDRILQTLHIDGLTKADAISTVTAESTPATQVSPIAATARICKMLPNQEVLANRLLPAFNALSPERVDVILLHYANEMTGAEAKVACPLSTKETVWFGGVYGPVRLDPKECTWREFHWGAENAETLRHFHALAIDAGECIGAWATRFGVQQATQDESSATRWLNVLFDIALDSPRDPLFPMPADWHYFANVAMFSLRFQMQGASEARINELKNEYRSLGALGYWAYLQDAVRASVYAIDVLTQEPLEFTTDGGNNRQKLAPVQGSVNPSTFAAQIRCLNKLPDYHERLRLCGLLIRQAVEAGQLADSKFDLLRLRLQSLDKADDDCALEGVLRWASEQGQTAFHPDEMRPDGMLATTPIEHNITAVADLLENAEMSVASHAERTGTTTADDVTPAIDALKREVAAIKRAAKKKTKTQKIQEQRNKFSRSRRPGKTWNEIYEAYRGKYPNDEKASPDTLRLTFKRNPSDNRQ